MPHLPVLLLSCQDNEKAKPAEKMAAGAGLLDGARRVYRGLEAFTCLRGGFDRSHSWLTPPKSAKILFSSPVMGQTLKDRGEGSSCEVLHKMASLCPALFQSAVLLTGAPASACSSDFKKGSFKSITSPAPRRCQATPLDASYASLTGL